MASYGHIQIGGVYSCAGSCHSENLLKSSLNYSASYLSLEGLSPPMLPRGDGTGLNLPYAVIIQIRTKSYNNRIY